MMNLPTRDEAVAYIMAHGLQDLLSRAANACVKADAADPVEFLTERLQEIKEETAVTLPTRAATLIYLKKERGLNHLLSCMATNCVHANAPDPVGFLTEKLKVLKGDRGLFTDLATAPGGCTRIEDTAKRAITLEQMESDYAAPDESRRGE